MADEAADVAARGRRAKIVYRLTAEGKEHFVQSLEVTGPSAWDDENFGVRFAFFSRTDSPTRVRILEGRRNRLEERLEGVKTATQRSRDRVDAYTLELQRHGLEAVERDVKWLTELIDRERSGGLPAQDGVAPEHKGRGPVPEGRGPDLAETSVAPTTTDEVK